MTNKDHAIQLAKQGMQIIPTNGNKKPLVPWEKFITERIPDAQVNQWWLTNAHANPAIVTGKLSGIVVIDIDGPEGEKEFLEFMGSEFSFANIPTVKTPRGGYHFYYRYPEKEVRNTTNLFTKVDVRGQGGYVLAPPSKNPNGNYQWINDLSVGLPEIPDKLLKKLTEPRVYVPATPVAQVNTGSMLKKGTRDNDLFHLACQFAKAGTPRHEAVAYMSIYAHQCDPPFDLREMQRKLDSAYERYSRKDRNIKEEIKQWVTSSEGVFTSQDLKANLNIIEKADKHTVDVILNQLRNEKIIEKYGNKRGVYRIVNEDVEEIDIFAPTGMNLDLKFPLNIERYFEVMPRNILCVAGEPNSGKTGFLLSFAEMNMRKHKINYFSSEMAGKELQSRLRKFEIPYENWKHVKFLERSSNFADVIKPNEVNIIDFLEITNEFYLLGDMMKAIYNKLENGICFIAIQKNANSEFGLGGQRGLEKPRLYFTLSNSHILRLVKVKNWRDESVNPNGLACGFKLVQGHKFIQQTPFSNMDASKSTTFI